MRNVHINEKDKDVYCKDGSFVVCPIRSIVQDFVPCNAGCAWFSEDEGISGDDNIAMCKGTIIGNITKKEPAKQN